MNARIIASNVVSGLLALAVVAQAPYALSAEPSSSGRAITVRYADLNLASASGVEALYGRIRRAGDRVCGPRPDNPDFKRLAAWKDCRDTAIADAVEGVSHPMLTAVHRGGSAQATATLKARPSLARR